MTAFAFEIQRHAAKNPESFGRYLTAPGMWAQRLTTAEPDEEELEVAVAALAAALEAEPATAPEATTERPAPAPPRLDEAYDSG